MRVLDGTNLTVLVMDYPKNVSRIKNVDMFGRKPISFGYDLAFYFLSKHLLFILQYLRNIFGLFLAYPCMYFNFYLLRRRRPGTGDIATPPVRLSVCLSVRLSVTFSFRTVTQKRIDVFSRNFAGTCTMSWGCAV